MFFLLPASKMRLSCFFDVISGKKPPLFYTDTLRGFLDRVKTGSACPGVCAEPHVKFDARVKTVLFGRFPHRKEPPRRAALSVKIMVRRSVFPDHCPRITYYLSIPYCAQSFVNSSDPMKPSRMDSRLCPFLRRSIHAIRPCASASRFRKVR